VFLLSCLGALGVLVVMLRPSWFRQTFENLNNLTNENIDIKLNAQNQMIGKPNNFFFLKNNKNTKRA
jgi:hypothetical protein